MNRYPQFTDSDEWGVAPNAGHEISMSDDELKQFEKDRAAREAINGAQTLEFEDRQLQKALEHLAAVQAQ